MSDKYNKLKDLDKLDKFNLSKRNFAFKSLGHVKNDTIHVFPLGYKDLTVLTGRESEQTLRAMLYGDIKTISFKSCFFSEEYYKTVAKLLEGKQTKVLFTVNEENNNPDCIFDEEQTKTLARNVNIFLSKGIDAQIYSQFNSQVYPLDVVLDANRKLEAWVNLINNAKVDGRELSPLEKYMYAFITVSTYFDYKMEAEDESPTASRALVNVLTGDKIVCVGFAELLSTILNKVGVPCIKASVLVENSKTGHAVCLPYINDSLYGCNGIVYSDPTSKSLAYSMVALKDFEKVFGNISFVRNGLGSEGQKQVLENYLKSLQGFSAEDYALIKSLIEENLSAPKRTLTLEEVGEESYQNFQRIVNKVLKGKELTKEEVRTVMIYNFQSVKAFKEEVLMLNKRYMFFTDAEEKLVQTLLFNSQRAVYRHKHRRDNSITKLSSSAGFSQEALIRVFQSMGQTKEVSKRYATALINKAIEKMCLSTELLNPIYIFNLEEETENFFIKRLKELSATSKPKTFEEASKAYYETKISYKLGKITEQDLIKAEALLDEKTSLEMDASSAGRSIKGKINTRVMNKGGGKE